MQSTDEVSDALGWDQSGSNASTTDDNGKGTFSVMICLPLPPLPPVLEDLDESVSASPFNALDAPVRASSVSFSASSVSDVSAKSSTIQTSTPSESRNVVQQPNGAVGSPRPAVESITPIPQAKSLADCEILATIKLHRAWMGLRVDEAKLLSMVHRRNEAQENGYFGTSKVPALYALEVAFQPSILGSSYIPAPKPLENPFGYNVAIGTPDWIRAVVEVQAVEAFGDVPVLVKQVGAAFSSVLSQEQKDEDVDDTPDDLLDDNAADVSSDDTLEDQDSLLDPTLPVLTFEPSISVAVTPIIQETVALVPAPVSAVPPHETLPAPLPSSSIVQTTAESKVETNNPPVVVGAVSELNTSELSSSSVVVFPPLIAPLNDSADGKQPLPEKNPSTNPSTVSEATVVLPHVPVIQDQESVRVPTSKSSSSVSSTTSTLTTSVSSSATVSVLSPASTINSVQSKPMDALNTPKQKSQAIVAAPSSRSLPQTKTVVPVVASPPRPVQPSQEEKNARRLAREAAQQSRASRKAAAIIARNVASSEFSARLGRYLRSDDLRVAVNIFISALSVPAPPISGLDDEPDELMKAGASGRGMGRIDPVLQDLAGFDPHHHNALLAQAAAAASKNPGGGRVGSHLLRKVLALTINSHHSMQTSIVPEPGSALIVPGGTGTLQTPSQASPGSPSPQSSLSSPSKTLASTATSANVGGAGNLRNSSSQVPVLSAPAIAIDVQISLLTLLDDVLVMRSALDTVAAIS
jgi:hypothetical protein